MATQLDPIERAEQASPQLAPVKGLLILGAVAVVMGLFLALSYSLGITQTWVSFMFTLLWGTEKLKFDKLPACVLGALTGLAVAYALQELLAAFGPAGLALVMGVIVVMVYCAIMQWLAVAINTTCWAFLTIGAAPVIQAQVDFRGLFAALALGVIYFAGLAWLVQLFMKRAAPKAKA